MKKNIKRLLLPILITVLILCIVLSLSKIISEENLYGDIRNIIENKDGDNKSQRISTTSDNLIKEYKKNKQKADEKYISSDIEIKGIVEKVEYNSEDKDILDTISLKTKDKNYEIVLFSPFDNEKEMNKLEKYKKGDSITVLGYFDNALVEDDLIYIVIDIDEITSIKN